MDATNIPDRPLVTAIVVVYNQEGFIEEAVRSVLAQEGAEFECIVVDDGSTDRTPDILAAINDPRLRVIRQENKGLSGARNAGIEAARGEIIAFLDGDDRWRPGRLARDIAVYESEPTVGVVFHNFIRFSEQGTSPADAFTFYPELPEFTSRIIERLNVGIMKAPCFELIMSMAEIPTFFSAVSVRRSVLGSLRFIGRPAAGGKAPFVEDWHLFPLLTRETVVAYSREPLAELRRHGNNFTTDVDSMVRAKLGALVAMRASPMNKSQRSALDHRIGRMHADAGHYYVRQRQFRAAATEFLRSGREGRILSCLKGFAVLLLALVRAPARMARSD